MDALCGLIKKTKYKKYMNYQTPHGAIVARLDERVKTSGVADVERMRKRRIWQRRNFTGFPSPETVGETNALYVSYPLTTLETKREIEALLVGLAEIIRPIAGYEGCFIQFDLEEKRIAAILPDHAAFKNELPRTAPMRWELKLWDLYCVATVRLESCEPERKTRAGATVLFGWGELGLEGAFQEMKEQLDRRMREKAEVFGEGAAYEGCREGEEGGLDFMFIQGASFHIFHVDVNN